MGANGSGPSGPVTLTQKEIELGLDRFNLTDPKTQAEIQRARSEAQRAGIGTEFDQLMLDYEREWGRLLKATGAVGNILQAGRQIMQPRGGGTSIIHVRGR